MSNAKSVLGIGNKIFLHITEYTLASKVPILNDMSPLQPREVCHAKV